MHQLNETVVGDRSWKFYCQMPLHIALVKMLHTPETPKMKEYLNCNDLAVRHHWGLFGGVPDQVAIEFLFDSTFSVDPIMKTLSFSSRALSINENITSFPAILSCLIP